MAVAAGSSGGVCLMRYWLLGAGPGRVWPARHAHAEQLQEVLSGTCTELTQAQNEEKRANPIHFCARD